MNRLQIGDLIEWHDGKTYDIYLVVDIQSKKYKVLEYYSNSEYSTIGRIYDYDFDFVERDLKDNTLKVIK